MVARTPTEYEPPGADGAEVTCSVVEALVPGLTARLDEAKVPVHPAGTVACSVKLEEPQPLLSVLVTVTL